MRLRFCLDRVEGGIAVCLCESEGHKDERREFSLDEAPALRGLADGTLFEAELDGQGCPRDVVVLSELTEQRKAQNSARLRALFDKSKAKNN